jgi:hypothetical protein
VKQVQKLIDGDHRLWHFAGHPLSPKREGLGPRDDPWAGWVELVEDRPRTGNRFDDRRWTQVHGPLRRCDTGDVRRAPESLAPARHASPGANRMMSEHVRPRASHVRPSRGSAASSVGHRPLLAWLLLGLPVKAPWQFLRGVVQGGAEGPGVSPRRSGRGRVGIPVRSVLRAERWIQPACVNDATAHRRTIV